MENHKVVLFSVLLLVLLEASTSQRHGHPNFAPTNEAQGQSQNQQFLQQRRQREQQHLSQLDQPGVVQQQQSLQLNQPAGVNMTQNIPEDSIVNQTAGVNGTQNIPEDSIVNQPAGVNGTQNIPEDSIVNQTAGVNETQNIPKDSIINNAALLKQAQQDVDNILQDPVRVNVLTACFVTPQTCQSAEAANLINEIMNMNPAEFCHECDPKIEQEAYALLAKLVEGMSKNYPAQWTLILPKIIHKIGLLLRS